MGPVDYSSSQMAFMPPRRSATAPVLPRRSNSTSSRTPSPSARNQDIVETLYNHPSVKIIAFTTNQRVSLGTGLPSQLDVEPGSLPPSSRLERTIAIGAFRIYRAPGSVAFLSCGSALQPILPKSQCWCIAEDNSRFVLQIRRPQYWRIELPLSEVDDIQRALLLRNVFDQILQFEKTECPFQRSFTVQLPAQPTTPVKKKAWTAEGKNLIATAFAELPSSSSQTPLTVRRTRRTTQSFRDHSESPSTSERDTTPSRGRQPKYDSSTDDQLELSSRDHSVAPEAKQKSPERPRVEELVDKLEHTIAQHPPPKQPQQEQQEQNHQAEHLEKEPASLESVEQEPAKLELEGQKLNEGGLEEQELMQPPPLEQNLEQSKQQEPEQQTKEHPIVHKNEDQQEQQQSEDVPEHHVVLQENIDTITVTKSTSLKIPNEIDISTAVEATAATTEVATAETGEPQVLDQSVGKPTSQAEVNAIEDTEQGPSISHTPSDCFFTPDERPVEESELIIPSPAIPATDKDDDIENAPVTPDTAKPTRFRAVPDMYQTPPEINQPSTPVASRRDADRTPRNKPSSFYKLNGSGMPAARFTPGSSSPDRSTTVVKAKLQPEECPATPPRSVKKEKEKEVLGDDDDEPSSFEGSGYVAPVNLNRKRMSRMLAGRSFTAPPQLTVVTSPPFKSKGKQPEQKPSVSPTRQPKASNAASPVGSTDSFHSVQSWHSPITPLPPSPPLSRSGSPGKAQFPHPHENIVLKRQESPHGEVSDNTLTPNATRFAAPSSAGATENSDSSSPMPRSPADSTGAQPSPTLPKTQSDSMARASALEKRTHIRRRPKGNNLSISRRALSPLPPAANLFSPPARKTSHNALAAMKRLPGAIINKTVEILLSPPSHLVNLMLAVAAKIAAGEWRGLVFGFNEGGEQIPVHWDYSDGEFSSWDDDDDDFMYSHVIYRGISPTSAGPSSARSRRGSEHWNDENSKSWEVD